jgi:hypothetical protein
MIVMRKRKAVYSVSCLAELLNQDPSMGPCHFMISDFAFVDILHIFNIIKPSRVYQITSVLSPSIQLA